MDVSFSDDPVEGVIKIGRKHQYPFQEESIPYKEPEIKGKPIRLWAHFDADHAHDLETRYSVTRGTYFHQQLISKVVCQKAKHSGDSHIWLRNCIM